MLRPLTSVAVLALVGVLGACGSDDPSANATDSGPAGVQTSEGPQVSGPGGGQFPGAFGEIAAVQGRTLQVQNPQSGQVAVTYGAQTAITQQVDAALSDVTVGSCVMVGSDAAGSETDTVAATSVRISQPTDGSCQAGLGGRGDAPSRMSSVMPSGAPPSGAPSGAPSDGTRTFGGAFGEVTAVDGDGFTVRSQRPGSTDPESVTVTVSAETTYSTEVAAQAAALKVGRCVQASGDADATGAITAERIAVSDKVDGQCGGGFGQLGGPPEQNQGQGQ